LLREGKVKEAQGLLADKGKHSVNRSAALAS
jgi:hypothetical protein